MKKLTLFRISAAVLTLAAISASEAATYTYNETTSTTTQWAAGTSWDATPISAVDTILSFTGDLTPGTNIVSNNDIGGNFLLNALDFTYNGTLASPSPTVTISGNPLEFTGAGAQITYNADTIGGNSGANRPQLIIDSDIILTSALTVFGISGGSDGATPPMILNGVISGANSLTFSGTPGATISWLLTNTSNSYTGDTRLTVSSTSGRSKTLQLGTSEVIPNGVGKGNLFFEASNEQGTLILDMNGFNETINGLASISPDKAANANVHQVRNDSATNTTLTIGDADTSATYVGRLLDGSSTGTLGLTKIGSGTQVLSGLSTHTGDTTIEGGTLKVDYSIFGTSKTSDPTDYFSLGSTMILGADTTFVIEGRGNGATTTTTNVDIGNGSHTFVLANSIADTLVVGQELLFTKTGGAGTPDAESYIVAMERGATDTIVYGDERLSGGGASIVTVDTTATTATTNQTLAGLTLSGAALSNATIDLGSTDNVILTISSAPVQLVDGSTLTIANWDGSFAGGGGDQWLFDGATSDFSSVFTQSEIIFDGYGAGYALIDYGGSYEVVAVPEPSTFALMAGSLALLTSVRRRRNNLQVS